MARKGSKEKIRCSWVPAGHVLYEHYHDTEWGRPVKDDRLFFEFLVLESAQAGLSWETILKRREGYRSAFANFSAEKIARFGARDVARLMQDNRIIRHRLKIESTITNAQVFLTIQREWGSFSKYVRSFVDGTVEHRSGKKLRTTSPAATLLSVDLKGRGFQFFGPVIAYAFMQATGLVDDHSPNCFRYRAKPNR
ncbi:MAG: DNA-3-methyladenine glycosylase I [Candidatus Moraniibacteriota bacterium]